MTNAGASDPSRHKPGVGDPLDDPLVSAARAYPGLAITFVAGGIIVLRLLAISEWRVDVAVGLLASAGVANTLIGSAVTLLPYIAPTIFLTISTLARGYYRAGRRAEISLYATGAAGIVSLLLTPALVLAFIVLLFGGSWLFDQLRARRGSVRTSSRFAEDLTVYVAGAAGLPILLSVAFNSTPWLPPEIISVRGAAVVGYVAAADTDWTQVLLYDDHSIRILATSTVTGRVVCEPPRDLFSMTLPELLRARPAEPACPIASH